MIRIRAEGVGKAYPVYRRPIDSLKEVVFGKSYHDTVWAVRDVGLSVTAGGAVGVIGDNGAGKTTLLKVLAGALQPTCGRIEHEGQISSILELGTGFHIDLSGYENIRIGCAIMGLSPAQTAARLSEIVAFSELESVLDRPVKTYSSGMFLRLAFSVAAAIRPDILVVDEHLSVGDQHFRKKCMDRITRLLAEGMALVFCSHDLFAVREICTDCLWLRDGQPEMFGSTGDVLDAYQDYVRDREAGAAGTSADAVLPTPSRVPDGDTRLLDVTLGGDCHEGVVESGATLTVSVRAQIAPAARRDGVHVGLLIIRNDRVWCYGVTGKGDGVGDDALTSLGSNQYGICMVFEALPLLAGQYSFNVALIDNGSPHIYDSLAGVAAFRVTQPMGEVGVARLPHRWEPMPQLTMQHANESSGVMDNRT